MVHSVLGKSVSLQMVWTQPLRTVGPGLTFDIHYAIEDPYFVDSCLKNIRRTKWEYGDIISISS